MLYPSRKICQGQTVLGSNSDADASAQSNWFASL